VFIRSTAATPGLKGVADENAQLFGGRYGGVCHEFSDELSRRRAQTVASELVMLGIDPALIVIQARGASLLARPTPPNRLEPLNRRVTVGVNF